MRSSRYMNEGVDTGRSSPFGGVLGTSALGIRTLFGRPATARLRSLTHVPQRVWPSLLPEFDLPFPVSISPHHEDAKKKSVEWAGRMGLLNDIWDEPALTGFDFALCSAGIDPDATPEELKLSAEWLTWGTYAADYYPLVFGRSRNLEGAKLCDARFRACMPVDEPAAGAAVAVSPMERGLADLYQKEIEFEGELHNGVLVVQSFFDCDYPTGVTIIDDLMRGRLRQFLYVKEHELPLLCEEFELDKDGRAALDTYVRELEDWIAAILNWHQGIRRYREEDLRGVPAPTWQRCGPTGLGTSAARIVNLFAQPSPVST
jgi:hypothetical protein